jgi:O-antigen ligase
VLQVLSGDVVPWTGTVQFGRATGFTTHPNDLGGLAAVAFVPAVMLAARRSLAAPQRVFSWLLLLFVAAGLVLSGSVGALLAAAAAIFVWFAFQRSSVQSLLVFGALAACVVGVVTIQAMRGAPTPLERFDIVTNPSESAGGGSGSLDARITTYEVAAAEIKKNPFVGVGFDLVSITRPFGIVSYEYDVHNVIIGTWYKAGLFGLAGMLIALFAIFRVGWMAILASRSEAEQAAAVALVSAVVAFVVFAMSAPVLFSRFGWISAALLLAFRAVQRESRVARVSWDEADLRGMSLAPARP